MNERSPMRMARIKISGRGAVYHCMSRVVGGQRLLGPLEKEKLREMKVNVVG